MLPWGRAEDREIVFKVSKKSGCGSCDICESEGATQVQHKGAKFSTFKAPYLSSLSCPTQVSQAGTVGTEVIISLQGLERWMLLS